MKNIKAEIMIWPPVSSLFVVATQRLKMSQ